MKKVTMKDVAAAAGVSVAAVSRVMNGSGYVAPDKREAILQANPTGTSRVGPEVIQCFVNCRARQVGITPQVRCGELMGREG